MQPLDIKTSYGSCAARIFTQTYSTKLILSYTLLVFMMYSILNVFFLSFLLVFFSKIVIFLLIILSSKIWLLQECVVHSKSVLLACHRLRLLPYAASSGLGPGSTLWAPHFSSTSMQLSNPCLQKIKLSRFPIRNQSQTHSIKFQF